MGLVHQNQERGLKGIVHLGRLPQQAPAQGAHHRPMPIHERGKGRTAFRLGANIVAYATGMEPPKSRLFDVKPDREQAGKVPRGYLKVAQLRYESSDWQPAPPTAV